MSPVEDDDDFDVVVPRRSAMSPLPSDEALAVAPRRSAFTPTEPEDTPAPRRSAWVEEDDDEDDEYEDTLRLPVPRYSSEYGTAARGIQPALPDLGPTPESVSSPADDVSTAEPPSRAARAASPFSPSVQPALLDPVPPRAIDAELANNELIAPVPARAFVEPDEVAESRADVDEASAGASTPPTDNTEQAPAAAQPTAVVPEAPTPDLDEEELLAEEEEEMVSEGGHVAEPSASLVADAEPAAGVAETVPASPEQPIAVAEVAATTPEPPVVEAGTVAEAVLSPAAVPETPVEIPEEPAFDTDEQELLAEEDEMVSEGAPVPVAEPMTAVVDAPTAPVEAPSAVTESPKVTVATVSPPVPLAPVSPPTTTVAPVSPPTSVAPASPPITVPEATLQAAAVAAEVLAKPEIEALPAAVADEQELLVEEQDMVSEGGPPVASDASSLGDDTATWLFGSAMSDADHSLYRRPAPGEPETQVDLTPIVIDDPEYDVRKGTSPQAKSTPRPSRTDRTQPSRGRSARRVHFAWRDHKRLLTISGIVLALLLIVGGGGYLFSRYNPTIASITEGKLTLPATAGTYQRDPSQGATPSVDPDSKIQTVSATYSINGDQEFVAIAYRPQTDPSAALAEIQARSIMKVNGGACGRTTDQNRMACAVVSGTTAVLLMTLVDQSADDLIAAAQSVASGIGKT